jgi:hypothetical protein
MLPQELTLSDLRNSNNFPASLASQHMRKDSENLPIFPAEHAREMRFEPNDKGTEPNRNTIEGVYKIEFSEWKRIKYSYPFDGGMHIVQRQKASDRNVVR